ncbi:electron transport complex subunit RsxC [Vibrio genomosp. F6]|uniref:electron transport complex subunit RsxC n=1 Tax=Vibrio genomosp. F6 TaxID=723172 RepID=UPI0010BDE7D5|nr:electron transport complex subunit RsxC [Vibrio genomosp. F6]TKF22531.1 electron transport complex subunit RsxC [Vibrio genomosp. F6]
MLSLIEQIRTGALWDFPGGVHPAENKMQSNQHAISNASIPSELVLPVKQHIGKAGDLIVSVGDRVLKGQALTKYTMSFMLPVHAPTSGTITAIEPRTTAHPSGLSELCIVITPDNKEEWIERTTHPDFSQLPSEQLIEIIRQAGVSGMGGAGFPTAKKIQSGLAKTDILIINAAECEPYITADDKLMQEHADELIQGIEIVEQILKPELTIIGIEDNKPEAVKALEIAAINKNIVIRVIPTKYPSGGEKQLIKILTNKEVPVGSIPADIGILVQNVGSLHAIKRAVVDGEPLIKRVITLTGKTFKQERNVWALIGTPVQDLLNEFGYSADKKFPRLIMGGPMMGFALPHAIVPITKTTNCILAPTRKEIAPNRREMACIRCSQCAEACPASLLPQQLQWHARAEEYDKCEELNLKDCIECGACAFVCPSEIPLVQYYRQAKSEIKTRKQEADSAERARIRFEEKNARLERDKAERENRFKKAADNRRQEMKKTGGDDAIAAAIARVKAQQSTTEQPEKTVKPAVAAAIARTKAKQAAAQNDGKSEPDNSEMMKLREERKRQARERKANKEATADSSEAPSKKDAVAAAIARAKARKAKQAESETVDAAETVQASDDLAVESAEQAPAADPKKAAVAAAIARAKARKAKQAESETVDAVKSVQASDELAVESAEQAPAADPKKAAVAAAIARAKARKAKQAESETVDAVKTVQASDELAVESTKQAPAADPKKAAVAAAIARAKARKAKQAESETVDAAETVQASDELAVETTEQAPATDPKKAAVAAAIARAKARKAKQTESETKTASGAEIDSDTLQKKDLLADLVELEVAEQAPPADPKKAAVAATIARAKARKAQTEKTEMTPTLDADVDTVQETSKTKNLLADIVELETTEQTPAVDPKKAAVAAAIARAKARKAKQMQDNEENE